MLEKVAIKVSVLGSCCQLYAIVEVTQAAGVNNDASLKPCVKNVGDACWCNLLYISLL